jgi:hypothetical protein
MTPEPQKERKRDTYHEHGPRWHAARRLYLDNPLVPSTTLAEILDISRQCFDEYTRDLKEERARLRAVEIERIRREAKL